jgi:hypothetical protein
VKRALLTIAIAMLLPLSACGGKPRPEASPAPIEPAAPPPKPVAPPPEPEATAEQLPLEDDFAAQAEQEITSENYRAALDAIEKEMKAPQK